MLYVWSCPTPCLCVSPVLLAFRSSCVGKRELVFVLIVHLFVSYAHVNLCQFFSSPWCQAMPATSAYGFSWTFLLTYFQHYNKIITCFLSRKMKIEMLPKCCVFKARQHICLALVKIWIIWMTTSSLRYKYYSPEIKSVNRWTGHQTVLTTICDIMSHPEFFFVGSCTS